LKHVGANNVTSVTAYVILYSYIQVHKLVQIKSMYVKMFQKEENANDQYCDN